MIIAQISDLHLRTDGKPLRGGMDSVAALDAAIRHLNALPRRPDLALVTGDLANKAEARDYVTLGRMLEDLEMPAYVIPGNHDDRRMVHEAFVGQGYLPADGAFLHYTLEDYPLRLIGLDTLREGSDGGEMCAARRQWLADRLAEQPHRPTLIFMHHPPFRTGIAFMDKLAFVGAAELEAVVAGHPQVVRVICGHSHRGMQVQWGGTSASVAPSLVFQMVMDLNEGAESGFVLEPPCCPIYMWESDERLIAHMSIIGDFGPSHPFTEKPK